MALFFGFVGFVEPSLWGFEMVGCEFGGVDEKFSRVLELFFEADSFIEVEFFNK